MKHGVKKAKISVPSLKKPSTGQIRRSVRDSLEEILLKRYECISLLRACVQVVRLMGWPFDLDDILMHDNVVGYGIIVKWLHSLLWHTRFFIIIFFLIKKGQWRKC